MQEATLFDVGPLTRKREPNPCVYLFGPGPEGKTCRACIHLRKYGQSRSRQWFKCLLRRDPNDEDRLGGPKTDHRARWNACARYDEGVF